MIWWFWEHLFDTLYGAYSPMRLVRPAEEQQKTDSLTHRLTLYHTPVCPYCIKVRRVTKRLNLNIETRDISRHSHWRAELLTHGGKVQVPCLKIMDEDGTSKWMYESADIVQYLTQRFSPPSEK